MSEELLIGQTSFPRTRQNLAAELVDLGLSSGMTVVVHSSLSSLGWVCGGPVAVIQALMDVITESGTIVMPAHSGDYSDPEQWGDPPVPREWIPVIRDSMPAFDKGITPTRGMGAIAELFRTWPGVLRSSHPAVSFAAWGRHSREITDQHSLDMSLGEGSPLAKVYDFDGMVLLLGVGFDRNTSFHLAEYRAPHAIPATPGAPIAVEGRRVWATYDDIEHDTDLFAELGAAYECTHPVRRGMVGSAESRLFRQREAVDYAEQWLALRRGAASTQR